MKSHVVEAKVNHLREGGHQFSYKVFYLLVDVKRLKFLSRGLAFLSYNKSNIFSFQSKDFINFSQETILENFKAWLKSEKENSDVEELFLLAHPRTFGFSFNPISIFLYQLKSAQDWYAVAEVDNTFGEAKMFSIGKLDANGLATVDLPKNFYVSPFIPLDAQFSFRVQMNDNKVFIGVNSKQDGRVLLNANLVGNLKPLTNKNLLLSLLKNPHVTAKVFGGIHFEAMRLMLKRIPFIRKTSNPEMQRNYFDRKHHTKYVK